MVVRFLRTQLSLAQGLLLHPYQTMQEVIERKAYFWIVASPTLLWIALKLVWGLGVVPLVQLFYRCQGNLACRGLDFGADWITFFCLYWQILLVYLFVRFFVVLRR